MMIYSVLIALVLFFGGGGGKAVDLLDTVPTDAYWQAKNITVSSEQLQADAGPDKAPENVEELLKDLGAGEFVTRDKARRELERMGPAILPQLRPAVGSKDPEVAAVVSALVKGFTERGQERAIRRLMAIRTLGERREQAALVLLKGLVNSKELFVSDYALRAMAAIEGKTIEPVSHAQEFERDLALMPKETGILGQVMGDGQESFSLSTAIDDVMEVMKGPGVPRLPAAREGQIDKKKLLSAAVKRVLSLVECTGNLRLDGATVAVSSDIGADTGWAIILIRGTYNPTAVQDAFRLARHVPATGLAANNPAALARVDLDDNVAALFPSQDQLVFVLGSKPAAVTTAVREMTTSLQAGKGTLGENAKLMDLAKGVRKTGPAWLAAFPTADMKKDKLFEGIDAFTLETTRGKEAVAFTFKGQGEDQDKLKKSVDAWNDGVKWVQNMAAQQAQQNKVFTPLAEMFDSMKLSAEGTNATFTGEVKPAIRQTLFVELGVGMMMMLGEGTEEGIGQDGGQ
jgi:hypothetical protein